MKHFGLIGKNITHSISNQLHQEIARHNGLELTYEHFDVEEDEIEALINDLKKGKYDGFNVTVPYKEIILGYVDVLSENAKEIGAVNTLSYKNGQVYGNNTDLIGFSRILDNLNLDYQGKVVYILGSGGSSRMVYYAFKKYGATPVVVSRKGGSSSYFGQMISYEALSKMDHIDILVNCTPVGSYPNYGTPYEPVNQVIELVIDLIYNPRKTILMAYGIKSINGIDLLIYQGIASESIWQKKALKDDFVTIESIKEVLK